MNKEIVFWVVWSLFLVYFLFKLWKTSIKHSAFVTLFLWATLVLFTPIPEAGIIISFPLYKLFGIGLLVTQIVATAIAVIIWLSLQKYIISGKNLSTFYKDLLTSSKKKTFYYFSS